MRARLTYANVVASLALALVVGGGTYAASAQRAGEEVIKACVVKKGAAKGDVRITKSTCKSSERSVEWNQTGVPGATGAAGATGPSGSPDTPAQVLTKLLTVDGAGSGLDADSLDGLSNDVWHVVGAVGEPTFQNSWVNANLGPVPGTAAFTKDATGVVHIRGQVKNGTVSSNSFGAVFILPVGYRPLRDIYVPALTTNGSNVVTPGWVGISPTGDVVVGVGNNAFVSIELSFRL
jgi:hypothetical protein